MLMIPWTPLLLQHDIDVGRGWRIGFWWEQGRQAVEGCWPVCLYWKTFVEGEGAIGPFLDRLLMLRMVEGS